MSWTSIYSKFPDKTGWYAALKCYDPMEGSIPFAVYWNINTWDTFCPITHFYDNLEFDTEQEAFDFAYEMERRTREWKELAEKK
jgi:hypothetical protein